MTVTHTAGPRFQLGWPPWQPPGADGLAAIVAPTAATAWADGLLARDEHELVVWAATGADPVAEGLARLHYPGVRAVTLAPARIDPRRVRLGLELAVHLAGGRDSGPSADARLTSWTPKKAPPGVVRIPHLITIEGDGATPPPDRRHGNAGTDVVVWELTPLAVAQDWLGGPLPDLAFFEARLDALLRLRGAARRGQLPAAAVAAGLAERLRDRDLSIRLVYEHASWFRALLTARPNGTAADASR